MASSEFPGHVDFLVVLLVFLVFAKDVLIVLLMKSLTFACQLLGNWYPIVLVLTGFIFHLFQVLMHVLAS